MIHKNLPTFLILLFWTVSVFAQGGEDLKFTKTFNYGVMAHPKGMGLDFNYTRHDLGKTPTQFDLDLVSMKHPKEIKVYNNSFSNPSPYVFGKINSIYILRTGAGKVINLSYRESKRTIAVNAFIGGGLSMAFVKPVYLEIYHDDAGRTYSEVERYDPDIHTQSDIIGTASFGNGFGEMKIQPGLYAKTGVTFDWGNYRSIFKSIGAGVIVDVFAKDLPILAGSQNKSTFSGFYISFAFGNND